MAFEHVLFEVRDQIAYVTFNRPESMNAVNRLMAKELVDACAQVENDPGIRIAIFTGAGDKAFSAGMDLKERAESAVSPIERRAAKSSLATRIRARSSPKKLVTHGPISSVKFFWVQYVWIFAPAMFNNPLPWPYPH